VAEVSRRLGIPNDGHASDGRDRRHGRADRSG
jgi:hypothetical protein